MQVTDTGLDFMQDGGEMGARTRAYDWAASSLGPPAGWPQSLRLTIRLMLNTGHPMFIFWGPDLIQFYNDAYAETLGPERHPSALGQRGVECWREIWSVIGPQIDFVMGGKGSTWDEDRLIPVTRNGQLEQVWWTYSYGPIDLNGQVGGVLVVCNDVTLQHLAAEKSSEQNRQIQRLFESAPGFMTVLRGPDHIFELTNSAYRRLLGDRDFIGKPVREVVPEVEGQGFYELLDGVYKTGEPFVGRRVPIKLQFGSDAPARESYLDFVYQPIYEVDGRISGIFVEGSDVTDHVLAEEHLRLINNELKHRVKNTLAMVSAIATQTLVGTGRNMALAAFRERLAVFGRAHDILTETTWATAEIHDVVENALEAHRDGADRFSVSGPEITLGSKQALSLALSIHELATNAAKYGAMSGDSGRVDIHWQQEDLSGERLFEFVWRERGGPPVTEPKRQGFGTRLIKRALQADFGGELQLLFHHAGFECRLVTPGHNLQNSVPNYFV